MTDPTAGLLWAACRPEPAPRAVTDAVAHGADLPLAAQLAMAQRVSPLLWRALTAASLTTDEPWSDQLRRDAARCHAQSRMVLPRIGELALAPLADAGAEVVVIKGAALAPRYPDPDLRPMDDVDLVAPAHQLEATLRALTGAGWHLHEAPQRRQFQFDLTHPDLPGLHIDLHRNLASWRTQANRLTTQYLWATRRPAQLYGAPTFVLPPELELVMLAAHAAKPYHGFDRLIWTVDIAVVGAGGVDWDRVEHLAADTHSRTALAVALTQAARLGLDPPPRLRSIEGEWRAEALRDVMADDWPTRASDGHVRAALRYALVDDRTRRAALLVSEVFDKHLWNVPIRAARILRRRLR